MKKILVVEDAKNIREIIAFTLRKRGYDVIESGDGADGYKKAVTEKPDLIILDVMLPNKTGFEICSDLKDSKQYRNIPVIILTAVTKDSGKDDAYWKEKSRADEFLSKPFKAQDLVGKVEELVAKYEGKEGD